MKRLALPVLAASLALSACGSSDSSSSTTATTAPAVAGVDTTAAPTTTTPAAGASGTLNVTANEYAFAPTTLQAKAGKVKITLTNAGKITHEFVILKSSAAPDALKVGSDQRVSEKTSVGEVSETDAGKTKSKTLDLKPGTYVFVCNIPGHYKLGMRGTLTVS